jgi:hypothetical protein
VPADGRTVCVSIRRLKLLVQPLDRIGGSSDVAIPPREFPPHSGRHQCVVDATN